MRSLLCERLSGALFVVSFLTVAAPAPVFAQQEFKGQTVVSVSYEPVQQPIDRKDLAAMQLVQTGKPLDLAQVGTTIDHLFSSGFYDDIQVDAQPVAGGVAVRFITRARLFIGHVDVRGKISEPPPRAVIVSNAQLYLGTPYDPEDVATAEETIRQIMRDNGLFSGDVGSATITDPTTNEVTIRFLVNSGKRARYEAPVVKGETKLSNAAIVRATGWRIPLIHLWRKVSQQLTDKGVEGIQKKYAKQGRLTASVDVESMDYNARTVRAKPTLSIAAGPKLDIKAVAAKLSNSKIRKLVPVYEEGSVDTDLLIEGARNIQNYFQSRGYPDVEVTYKQEPEVNDEEVIKYFVALGPRRRLAHIEITGSTYFTVETLRERMFLQTNSILLRYGRYSETFRHDDEKSIENLYTANGFRNVYVTSSVQDNYKGKPNDIAVKFQIAEGPLWKVALLTINGTTRLDVGEIRDQLYSSQGQPYADVNVASDRNRILEYYHNHGFLRATFSYETTPGPVPNTVNLTYNITEGPQDFVRGVILSGLNLTNPRLVQHLITLKNDAPVSTDSISEITRKLTDLGVFAGVNSALRNPGGPTAYKYVLYDFDEAARYTFNVGFGLEIGQFGNTTNNLSNAGGVKGASPIVSFDVGRLNLFGIGQTLSAQTKYSSLEQRESLNYVVPRFLGSEKRTVTFSILYDTTQDVQTFSSHKEQVSVQTSQRFNRASTLLFRFDYRRVSTSNINIPSLIIPLLSQPVRIGMLSTSYIQDHRDNPADAHHGFWNTLDTGVAGNFFGSQRSFARVLGRNATYYSLGRKFVLARQTQIGAIIPFNIAKGFTSYDDIPLPERFFGGGSVSMRGFGDNQAGPRDIGSPGVVGTGFPIGGDALFFNNVELRFPLLGANISGVFFEDMGNIYTRLSDISFAYHQASGNQNFNYAVQAPGFGIRYKTPFGPVRVDFSYALNPSRYNGFSTSETTQQLIQCKPQDIGVTLPCKPGPQQLSHFNFFFSIGQAF
jgi:outer membrane protein insertion porin family